MEGVLSQQNLLSQAVELDPAPSGSHIPVNVTCPQVLQNEFHDHQYNAKQQIQTLMMEIVDSVLQNRLPTFKRPRPLKNSKDMRKYMANPSVKTKTAFGGKGTRNFTKLIKVMSMVFQMMQQERTSTIREMFYENLSFFGKQHTLSEAITDIASFLQVPREVLGTQASAKGLVAGCIQFTNADGEVISAADSRHGIIITNKLNELDINTNNAKCILFVEKDATFQRLLDEDVQEVLGPIILITGKGYPDLQTRKLLHILNRAHRLKVYALVDCDPYGIEIAAVVRWGSYRNSNGHPESNLAVPDLVWLGLLPSEVAACSLPLNASAELNEKDRKKIQSLEERIHINNDFEWYAELHEMRNTGLKTELEALFSSPMYTTQVYLPSKLQHAGILS